MLANGKVSCFRPLFDCRKNSDPASDLRAIERFAALLPIDFLEIGPDGFEVVGIILELAQNRPRRPPQRLDVFCQLHLGWREHDDPAKYWPALAIAPTSRLNDRIEAGRRAPDFRKIDVHAGFDQARADQSNRLALLQATLDLGQRRSSMKRAHQRRKVNRALHVLDFCKERLGVRPRIDDDEHLSPLSEARSDFLVRNRLSSPFNLEPFQRGVEALGFRGEFPSVSRWRTRL